MKSTRQSRKCTQTQTKSAQEDADNKAPLVLPSTIVALDDWNHPGSTRQSRKCTKTQTKSAQKDADNKAPLVLPSTIVLIASTLGARESYQKVYENSDQKRSKRRRKLSSLPPAPMRSSGVEMGADLLVFGIIGTTLGARDKAESVRKLRPKDAESCQ